MVRVLLDTTAFCKDFTFSGTAAQRLLEAAALGEVQIHVSEVVVAETKRRYLLDLASEAKAVRDKTRPLAGGRFGEVTQADVWKDAESAISTYPERLDELLKHDGITREPYPSVSHEELVTRDLEGRRPFRVLKQGTTGYRDTLIWLTVLEVATRHPEDDIVFVTYNSSDYTDSTKPADRDLETERSTDKEPSDGRSTEPYQLARELRDEVATRLGTERSIPIVRTLGDLVTLYLPSTSEDYLPTASRYQEPEVLLHSSPEVRGRLLEALSGSTDWLFDRTWGKSEDHRGDLVLPEVDLEIPDWFEDPQLEMVGGPVEMVIDRVAETSTPGNWIVTATYQTELNFAGFAYKGDLYVHDDPDVDVVDPDWNDHMAAVGIWRLVAVTAEVLCVFEGNELTEAQPTQIESITPVSSK